MLHSRATTTPEVAADTSESTDLTCTKCVAHHVASTPACIDAISSRSYQSSFIATNRIVSDARADYRSTTQSGTFKADPEVDDRRNLCEAPASQGPHTTFYLHRPNGSAHRMQPLLPRTYQHNLSARQERTHLARNLERDHSIQARSPHERLQLRQDGRVDKAHASSFYRATGEDHVSGGGGDVALCAGDVREVEEVRGLHLWQRVRADGVSSDMYEDAPRET